jgi:hypothetical protein
MSFVSSILGGSAGKSAGFEGQQAPIIGASNTKQAEEQYGNVQSGLGQQQAFANAVGAQGGLGNQANVFAQQQALAGQLQQQALGQGPNPAQAALAQSTGANVAQQAALMGSQRGSSANAGMLGRNIAQQGGALQQQAVGQSATMQAQQQLAAQQALAQQQNAMQNVAGAQVGQQAGAIQGYGQQAQGAQQNVLNALAQQNNANVGMQSNINQANAGVAQANVGAQSHILGGLMGGVGAALMAHGGEVKGYADGGKVKGPGSAAGKFLSGAFGSGNQGGPNMTGSAQGSAFTSQDPLGRGSEQFGAGISSAIGRFFGSAPATPAAPSVADFNAQMMDAGRPDMMEGKVESGNDYAPGPTTGFQNAAHGGMASSGGGVKGKAKVKGDSLKNDTVPTMLSPGEVVIPRSVMNHPNAPAEAAKFVAAVMAKKGLKK